MDDEQGEPNPIPMGIPKVIREVVVDPMWGGATAQIGGAVVTILALEHPSMGWTHYVFSPESQAKLARWAAGERPDEPLPAEPLAEPLADG
jgi:hypothetical protein